MELKPPLDKLAGTDRRSVGRVDEVIADVEENTDLFATLVEGMLNPDAVIRMRAADATEKITADRQEWLAPFKAFLLDEVAEVTQQEIRWHLAQMLPRLQLTESERLQVVAILLGYLADESKIVRTFSMQALADLAVQDPTLRPRVIPVLRQLVQTGSPAMVSRGRKLLKRLGV